MGKVRVHAPQDLVAGASLIAVSLFALWASSPLDAGRMSAPGPGLLPRFLASLLCVVGVWLVVVSLTPEGLAKLVDSEVARWKKVLASTSKDATPPAK
jgi:hypothetical protein